MNFEKKSIFLTNIAYFFVIISGFVLICFFTLKFLTPFIIAAGIAFLVQKPAAFMSQKTRIKHNYCAAGLAVFLYLLLLSAIIIIIYFLYKNSSDLMVQVGDLFSKLSNNIKEFGNKLTIEFDDNVKNIFDSVFSDSILSIGNNLVSKMTSGIGNLIKALPTFLIVSSVTVVASCYMAKDYNRLIRFINNMIGKEKYKKITTIKNIVFDNILKICFSYLIIMVIVFIFLCIGFFVLNVNNFIIVAFIVAFVDLLPVLGTGIILLPWSVYCFVADNFYKGLGILTIYILVCILKNIIEPKIIGKQIGINPLLSLIAIYLGYKTIGFFGIVIFPIVLITTFEYFKPQIE